MSVERRREPRCPAQGLVWVRERGGVTEKLPGKLVDRSVEGFRAAFEQAGPASGATVEFEIDDARGVAIAMWTRRLGTHVECGFHIES